MLTDVRRFHHRAHELLASDDDRLTLSQFLRRERFSAYFEAHFVTPLVAAVWSSGPDVAGEYPARFLFKFLENHGMLSVTGAPQWRTVVGGSARYVEKAAKGLTAVQTSTPIRSIARVGAGLELRDDSDAVEHFDAAVIATHPDQALRMLAAPTGVEREVLSAIGYTTNPTVLHTDTRRSAQDRSRPGVVELPAARLRRPTDRGPPELQHESAPAPGHTGDVHRHAQRRRPRDQPGQDHRPDDLRTSRLHHRFGRRPAAPG